MVTQYDTFARYNGKCVIIMEHGPLVCLVRFFGTIGNVCVSTASLTEY